VGRGAHPKLTAMKSGELRHPRSSCHSDIGLDCLASSASTARTGLLGVDGSSKWLIGLLERTTVGGVAVGD